MAISSESATFMAAKHWFWWGTLQMVLTDEQVSFKMQSVIFLVFLNMRNLHDVVFLL